MSCRAAIVLLVVQIPCGGWSRPHSYYLGDVPEIKNCFSYVKDEIIYIHRQWVLDGERKILSRNLHMQFHGGVEKWSPSKLLGEHVGGSVVRSICYVSKISIVPSDVTNIPDMRNGQNAAMENIETPV
ncbi:unnamed protein product [Prunus armeniaca]